MNTQVKHHAQKRCLRGSYPIKCEFIVFSSLRIQSAGRGSEKHASADRRFADSGDGFRQCQEQIPGGRVEVLVHPVVSMS